MTYPLRPCILTSSSHRELTDIIPELVKCSQVHCIDLYWLRTADIRKCERVRGSGLVPQLPNGNFESRSTLTLLANENNRAELVRWFDIEWNEIIKNVEGPDVLEVSAFASYIPEIASPDALLRERAKTALANLIKMSIEIKRSTCGVGVLVPSSAAVIEFVCGSILRPQSPSESGSIKAIAVASRHEVIRNVVDVLQDVARSVITEFPSDSWCMAAEFEPGGSYVMNSLDAMKCFLEEVDRRTVCGKPLAEYVALNCDIAHLMLAGVGAHQLTCICDRFAHAHISDHPNGHIKDQVPGTWHNVFRRPSEFDAYLEMYRSGVAERRGRSAPVSQVISLELEGCGRDEWLSQGLGAIRHLLNC